MRILINLLFISIQNDEFFYLQNQVNTYKEFAHEHFACMWCLITFQKIYNFFHATITFIASIRAKGSLQVSFRTLRDQQCKLFRIDPNFVHIPNAEVWWWWAASWISSFVSTNTAIVCRKNSMFCQFGSIVMVNIRFHQRTTSFFSYT